MEILCCVFDSLVTVDNVYISTLQSAARDISEAKTIAMCKDLIQSEGSFDTLEPITRLSDLRLPLHYHIYSHRFVCVML